MGGARNGEMSSERCWSHHGFKSVRSCLGQPNTQCAWPLCENGEDPFFFWKSMGYVELQFFVHEMQIMLWRRLMRLSLGTVSFRDLGWWFFLLVEDGHLNFFPLPLGL